MSIYEYHSYEDESDPMHPKNLGQLYGGRWIVKEDTDRFGIFLEWADLFGHDDKKRLLLKSDKGFIQLLSEYLALLIRPMAFEEPQLLQGLRLDWKDKEIIKGERVLERSDEWNEAVIVDRAGPLPNGDICFLLIKDGEHNRDKLFEYAHHCRLDSRDLKIVRDSRPIPLDSDEFNCIDLNGDIISGLSTSLLEIKRYNFRTGKMVDTILVHGLPPTISCLWHKNKNEVDLTSRGAWTNSHLLVWSKIGEKHAPDTDDDDDDEHYNDDYLRDRLSSVYQVDLKTGLASATAFNFKGWIEEFVVGPSGNHLYIRVDEYLRRSSKVSNPWHPYYAPMYKFRYLRVPFNRPESLFFLASVALPRPLSPLALEIIKQNSKTAPIPQNIVQMTH